MKNLQGIVFDLYGTLFDVNSVASACNAMFPGRGVELSMLWRQKQLEYTWLRSLMEKFWSFESATYGALEHACARLGMKPTAQQLEVLCDEYFTLKPFMEVPATLRALSGLKIPLAILSNGSPTSIGTVVKNAGLTDEFAHLLSVDAVRVYKPSPKVYELAEHAFACRREALLFVSSNGWDVTGAGHFGFPTCWVNRAGAPFESMGYEPNDVISGLDGLLTVLRKYV